MKAKPPNGLASRRRLTRRKAAGHIKRELRRRERARRRKREQ